ncbi:DNA polymerase beta superfamily protein [Micromonospora sp. NPDC047730]|uniref:nucleotidyltransferase domain-containing protein n=1 Tax=Micromonospora sp. NPDC047730 TaxID=3364253 RepID=UPI00371ABF03
MHILLSGIVGSTAYGLAGPDSDVDRLGIFAAPTQEFHGLHRPKESVVTTAPDKTMHEAAKWARLALGCNPTAMELAWLPDHLYEVRTTLGDELIEMRSTLLSAPRVRDAYLGYAVKQFQKLQNRGDGTFASDLRKRTAKHARHLARLAHQGAELYKTGHLRIELEDPQWYHDFGNQVADGDIDAAARLLAGAEQWISSGRSPLPERADEGPIEAWLRRVRLACLAEA